MNIHTTGVKQWTVSLSPNRTKCGNSVIMSIICVFLENQISWHEHGLGMIAAHIPIAYMHESFTTIKQSQIKQVLLGIGGFFAFHWWLHVIAEQLGICDHEGVNQKVVYLWQWRLEQIKQLHAHTHWLDLKTRAWVFVWAVWEELYSRLPLRKILFTHTKWK